MEPAGFFPLMVQSVVEETPDATTLVFAPPGDGSFAYVAGQYLTLRLTIDQKPVLRCYSMSSAPISGEPLQITVKRVAGGLASNWLIENIRAGDSIMARPPSGNFVLGAVRRPLMLFAGGSGITPVFAILRQALAANWPAIRFFYASQSPAAEIFRNALDQIQAVNPERLFLQRHYDSVSGYPDTEMLANFIGSDAHSVAYVCGPSAFMNNVEAALTASGFDPSRVHSERFVMPAQEPVRETNAAGDIPVTIESGKNIHEISCRADQNILAAALEQHVPVPWSCGQGICGACIAEVQSGAVDMPENDLLSAEERREGLILLCQAKPRGYDCRVRIT